MPGALSDSLSLRLLDSDFRFLLVLDLDFPSDVGEAWALEKGEGGIGAWEERGTLWVEGSILLLMAVV